MSRYYVSTFLGKVAIKGKRNNIEGWVFWVSEETYFFQKIYYPVGWQRR